jgi:hypothetical protein
MVLLRPGRMRRWAATHPGTMLYLLAVTTLNLILTILWR